MRTKLLVALVGLLLLGGAALAANPVVIIETSMGNIKVELDEGKAPVTVKNYLKYVEDKHYDGTIFHRVIPDFMVQGGGFKQGVAQAKADEEVARLEKTTRDPIKNEAGNGLSNLRGTIAMARTNDPDSATAQFFINTVDNKGLDKNNRSAGYAVFGKVIEGMEVVDKIKDVKTKNVGRSFQNVPETEVIIKTIRKAN
jgi:cyclophilin family peptidyl-prolyl cis-trans isomerase